MFGASKNRYFIIAFQFSRGMGNISIETKDGKYLTYHFIVAGLRKRFPALKDEAFTIVNIIEVSKEDHECWKFEPKIEEIDNKIISLESKSVN